MLFGHKRRRPENSGAQYEVADFGPESEVESIAMAASQVFFFLPFFRKIRTLCYYLLGVIEERRRDERRGRVGFEAVVVVFVLKGLSCEVDSCSVHASFQSVVCTKGL